MKKKADLSKLTPFELKVLGQLVPLGKVSVLTQLDDICFLEADRTVPNYFQLEGPEGRDLVLMAESGAEGVAPEDWEVSELGDDGKIEIDEGTLASYFIYRLTGEW